MPPLTQVQNLAVLVPQGWSRLWLGAGWLLTTGARRDARMAPECHQDSHLFPGGLGARSLSDFARENYGVNIALTIAGQ